MIEIKLPLLTFWIFSSFFNMESYSCLLLLLILYVHVKSLRCVQLFVTLWAVACQPPLSMGFSRQEYWEWVSVSPPGDLPDPRTERASLVSPALAGGIFTTEPPGKPFLNCNSSLSELDMLPSQHSTTQAPPFFLSKQDLTWRISDTKPSLRAGVPGLLCDHVPGTSVCPL